MSPGVQELQPWDLFDKFVGKGSVRANKISGAVSVYPSHVGSGSRKERNRKSVPITVHTFCYCSLAHLACKSKFVVDIVFVGQKTLGGLAAPIFQTGSKAKTVLTT